MLQQLYRRYELETTLHSAKQQKTLLNQKLPQARSDLRAAEDALLRYEYGSFRGFLDRLSGKREDKLEQLRSDVRKAEAVLAAAQQEKQVLSLRLTAVEAELDTLPGWAEFRGQPGETGTESARLEALLLTEQLEALLEENHAALTESYGQLRGERSMELITYEELHSIHTRAEQSGESCRILLERMKAALDALEIPFEIPAYYHSPTAYTAGAGDKFHRIGRVRNAMDQALEVKKRVIAIRQQMEE